MSDSSANWLDHIGSDSHSDPEAEPAESSIGPVRTGATFEYALEGCACLRLLTDNTKVHPLHPALRSVGSGHPHEPGCSDRFVISQARQPF